MKDHEVQRGSHLGKGAFGAVQRVVCDGADYAMKLLHSTDDKSKEEFEKEISINSILPFHSHVTKMVAVLRGKTTGLVMELYELSSLEDVLKQPEKFILTFPQLVKVAIHVSSGLQVLHKVGVIHRDIATRNALMKSNYDAAVADFGMSRLLPEGSQEGVSVAREGIPILASAPETLTGRVFSKQSDVYMFGVFLWELFARAQPYCDSELVAKCNEEKTWVKFKEEVCDGLRPTLPDDWTPQLTRLIKKCWSMRPEDRPSMFTVNQELRHLKQDVEEYKLPLPSIFQLPQKIEEKFTYVEELGAVNGSVLGSVYGTILD